MTRTRTVATLTTATTAATGGPRSRKGEETRARLVVAAKEVFEEHGFVEARISDIAKRAGLSSHGAFYHYFDSKEQVF
ncbi:MAG: TetR/AcrR family transcriptional regulator, partial [Acidimicrobiales bacterium]